MKRLRRGVKWFARSVVVVGLATTIGCHHNGDPAASTPPPCLIDGAYPATAIRQSSTGSVCNLDDARSVEGTISIRRTGPQSAWVERKGKYGHTAALDPTTCTISADAGPSESRNVLGATFSGSTSYQARIAPDGSLSGTLNLQVRSTSMLVSGCTGTYAVSGKRNP